MIQNRLILAWSLRATLPSCQVEEFCPPRLWDGQGHLDRTGIELLAGLRRRSRLQVAKTQAFVARVIR
jgi:hypothetical protein